MFLYKDLKKILAILKARRKTYLLKTENYQFYVNRNHGTTKLLNCHFAPERN
jgi:hypothetical protein